MKKWLLLACVVFSWTMPHDAQAALTYPQHYEIPIKQVKSATLPVKQGHSNSAQTMKILLKNEAVYTTNTVIAGWAQLATDASFYVNGSMLTAPIGYGKPIAQETTIFKLTADDVVKGGGNVVVSTMKKGDLVGGTFAQPTAVQSLHLKPSTGSVDARYVQIISPTIRQMNSNAGTVMRERPSPLAKIITTLPNKLALRSYETNSGRLARCQIRGNDWLCRSAYS